jgi:hypothetical protein
MRYGSSYFVQLTSAVLLPAVVDLFYPQVFRLVWWALQLALILVPCTFFLCLAYEGSRVDGTITLVLQKYLRPRESAIRL